jgi:hypothetical protein
MKASLENGNIQDICIVSFTVAKGYFGKTACIRFRSKLKYALQRKYFAS